MQDKVEVVVPVPVLVQGEQQVGQLGALQVVLWCLDHRMPSRFWHRLLSASTIDR
jgi:hypothetical protein